MAEQMHEPVLVFTDPECGCISAVCCDNDRDIRGKAKFVAAEIRAGMVVQRMPNAEFQKIPFRCPAHPDGKWTRKRAKKAAAVETP